MINLIIADPFLDLIESQKLENAAVAALEHEGVSQSSDLSIVIDDDDQLRTLNKEFLGIDAPTDVLSFPSGEEVADPDTGELNLGDIIISYPRAAEQAQGAGYPTTNEMQLLVVHGVLHLLGHDHAEPEEKAKMWAAQQEILNSLGVSIAHLPE